MKEKDHLNQLFDHARSEKPIVDADRIEKLVASGKKVSAQKIKLGQARRGFIKPLNLIIMFATITSIVAIIFALSGSPEKFSEHSFQSTSGEESLGRDEDSLGKLSVSSFQSSDGDESLVISHQSLVRDKEEIAASVIKDTVFEGRFLELSKEELGRLGFEFDDNGFYYLNEMPNGAYLNFWSYTDEENESTCFYESRHLSKQRMQKELGNESFYPVIVSDMMGNIVNSVSSFYNSKRNDFDLANDTLVPVLFKKEWFLGGQYRKQLTWHTNNVSYSDVAKNILSDQLVWFRISPDFFRRLPYSESKDIELIHNRVSLLNEMVGVHDRVKYDFDKIFVESFDPIRIPLESLLCIGFQLEDSVLSYSSKLGPNTLSINCKEEPGITISFHNKVDVNDQRKSTVLLSLTMQSSKLFEMMFSHDETYEFDGISAIGERVYDVCIPIQVSDSSFSDKFNNPIFWFFPTEDLINCLPDSIAEPMKKEFNLNVEPVLRGYTALDPVLIISGVRYDDKIKKSEPEEAVPCQYFKSFCEGLPGLDNLNVYPNPTSGELNLEILLSEGKTIDYRIFDLSGRLMVDDVERKKYDDAGRYNLKMDLGHLDNGFYLLVLTDEGGARMTRRVVKN